MGKEEEEKCCSTQLIDFNGEFNVTGLEDFMKTTKLAECERSYVVVAIMGPVSSGKSTLMNHLFHTNFKEMDAFKGRTQTTKGIWIAKCVGIEPYTLAMDLEGTEGRGRERGEDDTTFEKQSALFALAISDIVIINMWFHDIFREHASNTPLLKTVFQVMMRSFSPRKTTLLFVIRDKPKTPLEVLEPILKEYIQKIWDRISKSQHHKDTPLSEFFNVEVTALSSYEGQEKEFKQQVAQLRDRFFHSIAPGGIAGDRRGVVPASGFSFSAQQIWKVTRENKDLELPPYKVMVATVRCEQIADEKFSQLASDEGWLALAEAIQTGPVSGFGKKFSSILDAYLSEYDMEAMYFDEGVRNLKRQQLESKALHFVYPAYQTILGHLSAKGLDKFKHSLGQSFNKEFAAYVRICSESAMLEFDQGCADADIKQANWDASKVREKLRCDIEFHVASVRSAKLSEIMANYKKQLAEALVEPTKSLFEAALFKKPAGRDTWASIRKILRRTLSELSTDLDGFELDQKTFDNMVQNLRNFAVSEVMKKTDEEARNVLSHMEDRQWWMSCIPWGCMPWILNFSQGP